MKQRGRQRIRQLSFLVTDDEYAELKSVAERGDITRIGREAVSAFIKQSREDRERRIVPIYPFLPPVTKEERKKGKK